MRRPHVYQRSAPRHHPAGHGTAEERRSTLRAVAAQLASMIDRVGSAGETAIADRLDGARIEIERLLGEMDKAEGD